MASNNDLAVGADFGGTKILGAVVDSDGNVLADRKVPTPYDGAQLLDTLTDLVRDLEEEVGAEVVGVGVGAAGMVSREGTLRFSPNVGGITDVHLREGLEKRLPGLQVQIENDANAATWGEVLAGAGQRRSEMVMATLGTGIGGGLVTSGRLFRGHNGFGAEFGHMTVVARGVLCACGNLGCWEAYASGRALGRMGREAAGAGALKEIIKLAGDIDMIKGEHVTQLARDGQPAAVAVMDEFAYWIAVGVSSLISILDPEIVVLGGGLAEESDLYIEKVHHYLSDLTFGVDNRPPVQVVAATLGEKAGAIGAAMLVHGDAIPDV